MKIGILGTRGIPNNYGGFEQFAEYLSKGLVKEKHEVYVYSPHNHPYQKQNWNGVKIIHRFDPEYKIGTAGQFIYDLNCILDCRKRDFDIILQLGYTSSAIWGKLLPKKSIIITNMDGLEWKRTKYNKYVQKLLLFFERLTINTSDSLIADSKGIQKYLMEKYKISSNYIPYGATPFKNPFEEIIKSKNLEPYGYDMLIARLEPENNIEVILNGVVSSPIHRPFLVIGNYKSNYGKYLKQKYHDFSHIRFIGALYDLELLNNLRYYSNIYYHGHSVGGTNPSLLEAMASSALICAHSNDFNSSILGDEAYYFINENDIRKMCQKSVGLNERQSKVEINLTKIDSLYSWDLIIQKYHNLFVSFLKR